VSEIPRAIDILQRGGLVAFPTETVYGLGADATNADAVRRIFEAKGRPSTNPLICHVADATVARRYARHWPDAASKLTDRFWPGPLTLILPKTPDIPPEVTAGLDSVGLRAPNHPLALELLKAFEKPLSAPAPTAPVTSPPPPPRTSVTILAIESISSSTVAPAPSESNPPSSTSPRQSRSSAAPAGSCARRSN